jgi:hypothetical protein
MLTRLIGADIRRCEDPALELDRVETPAPVNALGAAHIDMPLTPSRVWAAIPDASKRRRLWCHACSR